MAPPSESWRMILSQSNERLARRSRPGRRVLRRCDRPLHTRRRSRPTCRRRRRRRPPAARRPRRRRFHGRSGDARRATSPRCGRRARVRTRTSSEGSSHAEPSSVASDRAGTSPRSHARSGSPGTGTSATTARRWHDLGEDRGSFAGQPPPSTLLPRPNERACPCVVDDRGARTREREPPPAAFGAATHGPRPRRPAPLADGWCESRQRRRAPLAQRSSGRLADRAPLRAARGRARAPFDGTRARVTTPQRSRADSSRVRPARPRRARGGRPAPARGRRAS